MNKYRIHMVAFILNWLKFGFVRWDWIIFLSHSVYFHGTLGKNTFVLLLDIAFWIRSKKVFYYWFKIAGDCWGQTRQECLATGCREKDAFLHKPRF